MTKIDKSFKYQKYFIYLVKIIFCIIILFIVFQELFAGGLKSYYSYKDYTYQVNFSPDYAIDIQTQKEAAQFFTAKGNLLSNVMIYLGETGNCELKLELLDSYGQEQKTVVMNTSEYISNSWNTVGFHYDGLTRGKEYSLKISSPDGLAAIPISLNSLGTCEEEIFGRCENETGPIEGYLAIGFKFTYHYLTLGAAAEFLVRAMIFLFLTGALCFGVFNIEDLYCAYSLRLSYNSDSCQGEEFCPERYQKAGYQQALWYAIYFSVSFVMLYNPLDTIKNQVDQFTRVIGNGIVYDIDVSRRISNFSTWFFMFAVTFILFFLLANYFRSKAVQGENKKMAEFLDHFMVLANVSLVLRCITFFHDKSTAGAVFYFSSYIVMLVILAVLAYIFLGLEKQIQADVYGKFMISAVCISYPVAILIAKEWEGGRVLLGIITLMSLIVILLINIFGNFPTSIIAVKFSGKKSSYRFRYREFLDIASTWGVMVLCLIPFMTSFYIELIHILNQHSIFVSHPKKYYGIAVGLGFCTTAIVIDIAKRKKWICSNWKNWVYPWLVFGVGCLSVQIPLQSTYNPHVFEGANSSILITDFLNFGKIPIVEHYGGHMMTGVWEGILYGLLNHDPVGAACSPYAGYLSALLLVLFFWLVKYIWNQDMALFTALLFPFYNYWSYFGLGMLVCLAAIAYVRKNTYIRAMILWLAFVWCAVYRLDLGYAMGEAAVAAMIIYVLVEKNWKAIKQLGLTLIFWGLCGGSTWILLCMIKNISPISRLAEFLMISLSNQNWAFAGIGNDSNMVFVWAYFLLPFTMIICLIYTIFSKKFQQMAGVEKWILLLIWGLSYFANFSRGLVRHSIVEMSTSVVMWSAYIFLAIFLSICRKNSKWFLPSFLLLILCNNLFVQDGNFVAQPVVEGAVSRPGSITETWVPGRFADEETEEGKTFKTIWEQLRFDKEVVNRVVINSELKTVIRKYQDITDILLEDNETFVDFINKTLIFSLIGRQNPVYVSQSPLQLSGEFTQKQFIKEIQGIPIVLMPMDSSNYAASNSLDGIANTYRYYKVSEYIYQNYVPLVKYGTDFAVWCLPQRYEEFKNKINTQENEHELIGEFLGSDDISLHNCELKRDLKNQKLTIEFTERDPFVDGLQNFVDLHQYVGEKVYVTIKYETDINGILQLYYTTEKEEKYTEEKSIKANISGKGQSMFEVPVTANTKLRLDTPERSKVIVSSIRTSSYPITYIDYGYDGPDSVAETGKTEVYQYISTLHNYNINHLARLWAETDSKKSADNKIVAELVKNGDGYIFDNNFSEHREYGNYLLLSVTYNGADIRGKFQEDDENINATIILGHYEGETFSEKYRYGISLKEGKHDYLIRVSTDYYWYSGQKINGVKIECQEKLYGIKMQILEGEP